MEKKEIYAEIGTNFRYFLDWRHKLLAGYLVTVAGLGIGFSWAFSNEKTNELSWIILALGVLVTMVFWGLDYRNRDLYHLCQIAGMQIEKKEGFDDGQGIYTALETSSHKISHSLILDVMFILAALGFGIGAIIVGISVR